jgi:hypothetical protein
MRGESAESFSILSFAIVIRVRSVTDRFSMNYVFLFALGIGFAAGLRALTPPAVVAWAAHLGWLNLSNSPLAFMGSIITVVFF